LQYLKPGIEFLRGATG